MTFEWEILGPDTRFRDPELEFRVNMMKRFTVANLGLGQGDGGLWGDALRAKIDQVYEGLWWMAVVEVAKHDSEDRNWTLTELVDRATDQDLQASMIVPGEYGESIRDSKPQKFVSLFVQKKYIERANKSDGERALGVRKMSVTGPLGPEVVTPIGEPFVPVGKSIEVGPETVLVAVIDYGIAIGHDLFRRRKTPNGELDGSRVGTAFRIGSDAACTRARARWLALPATRVRTWGPCIRAKCPG